MLKKSKEGFSLVELSIVLIIVGLLFVGVSSGGKLIQAAKLNKIMSEISSVDSSFLAFFQAYEQYPGDFDDAQSFWGTSVRNGDNDGKVAVNPDALASDSLGDESSSVFIHMQSGEFIDGNYSAQIDQQRYAYETELKAHLIIANEKDSTDATLEGFQSTTLNDKNLIIVAKDLSATRAPNDAGVNSPFLTPREAYSLDKKYDDTLPKTGRITYRDETNTTTGSTTPGSCIDVTNNAYLASGTTSDSLGCNLVYLIK
jgi:prepilin-type N-terminal cleavage/methylation domain-containing protein